MSVGDFMLGVAVGFTATAIGAACVQQRATKRNRCSEIALGVQCRCVLRAGHKGPHKAVQRLVGPFWFQAGDAFEITRNR